jgi:hypothetical protein
MSFANAGVSVESATIIPLIEHRSPGGVSRIYRAHYDIVLS